MLGARGGVGLIKTLSFLFPPRQSSDSTQIEECLLRKSPVFPSSYCKAEVHIPRLSQNLVRTCVSSGFVWCSQDSSPLKSLPAQRRSPTFPKSPERNADRVFRNSPVFSESRLEAGGDSTPENCGSPVFGGNSPRVHNCNSEFMFSSQESFTSVVRSASGRPQSPVFPKSPAGILATSKSPGSSGSREEAQHPRSRCPAFDRTERLPQAHLEVQKPCANEASQRFDCAGGHRVTKLFSTVTSSGRIRSQLPFHLLFIATIVAKMSAWFLLFQAVANHPVGLNQPAVSGTVNAARALSLVSRV